MLPYRHEFLRHHDYLRGVLNQVPESGWLSIPNHGANSIAIIISHLAGNFKSRFTDFLTTDGEKPWRNRDGEFAITDTNLFQLVDHYNAAIEILFSSLDSLTEHDRQRMVLIRNLSLSVDEALCRSLAHMAFHVGEIVYQARSLVGQHWESLSIPLGASASYIQDPHRDRIAMSSHQPIPLAYPRQGSSTRAHALVIHHVADYPKWKQIFDNAAALRREAGEISFQVHIHAEDPHRVVHHAAWKSVEHARTFFESPEIEAIRKAAGVERPEFHYLQQLDGGAL
jgi:quinol monooxygenase YgiN